jgi:Rab-GTPase-TBC domain
MTTQVNGRDFPRSIRWQVQLGVLDLPTSDDWTLDVFAKFNKRRVWQLRSHYDTLMKEYEVELDVDFHLNRSSDTIGDLDPLSVFATESDAKARRHQRNSQRGFDLGNSVPAENEDLEETLLTIVKDLKRLQSEHNEIFFEHMKDTCDFDDAMQQRRAHLKGMLYFFAREHPTIGYQQGMHELASLVLLIVEMDTFTTSGAPELAMLLDPKYLLHQAYSIMEALLSNVGSAYSGDNLDVTSKVRYASGDYKFLDYVDKLEVEPELYCARWIRLLFSREVDHWKTVLPLWDIFFDLTSHHASILSMGDVCRYTRPGLTPLLVPCRMDWLTVLETAAVSLIWLQRTELLDLDPDDGFCWLVNMPPLTTVNRLMSTLLSTIRRVQLDAKPRQTGTDEANVQKSVARRVGPMSNILGRRPHSTCSTFTHANSPATCNINLHLSEGSSSNSCAETWSSSTSSFESSLTFFKFPSLLRISSARSTSSPDSFH